ncbi:TOBE-like domain-containing protein [Propionivibrio sp.]|uniref:TOBE-like domain-containing protein n=1 Tax=Propionivibrio sp. TaxID=2212460 RepID=UPI003BF358CD
MRQIRRNPWPTESPDKFKLVSTTCYQLVACVRLHAIDIEPIQVAGGQEAMVQNVHAIGPLVRVELAHAFARIEVDLTREPPSC